MAKFCTKCGTEMGGGKFCPECGYQAGAPALQAPQSTPPLPPSPGQYTYQQPAQYQQAGANAGDVLNKAVGQAGLYGGKALQALSNAEKSTNIHKIRLVIAALALIGLSTMFMPWLTVRGETERGLDMGGLGWIVFGFLAMSLVFSFLGNRTKPLGKLSIATAIFGAIPAAFTMNNINGANAEMKRYAAYMGKEMFSIGVGIRLAAFASVAIVVVSILSFIIARKNK